MENQHSEMEKETPRNAVSASNLLEYLQSVPEFEQHGEENSRELKCRICAEFLSNHASFSSGFRQPSGKSAGSLLSALNCQQVYSNLIAAKCFRWYHQKEQLNKHVAFKTHMKAVQYTRETAQTSKRKTVVVKNQLRTALGIVKSKAAALQYESRIAELQAAGADVGDFGHSKKLFPEMLSVACAYIDKRTATYLSTCQVWECRHISTSQQISQPITGSPIKSPWFVQLWEVVHKQFHLMPAKFTQVLTVLVVHEMRLPRLFITTWINILV